MARAFATDRLSALSDHFLYTRILSKISYRDIVRFSLLSKRWRLLWTKIPFLNFWVEDFKKQKDDKIHIIIDNALLHLDAHLCWLDLQIALDDPNTANMNNWIRLAAEKQVERIALQISRNGPGKRLKRSAMAEVGDSVFNCENLINLQLRHVNFPKIPTNFGVFPYLTTFYCSEILNVDDAMFEGFMDVCPHLRNLGIRMCFGLKNLNIHASNLMFLNLGVLNPDISLQMACPRLTEISLMDQGRHRALALLQGISGAESVKIITLQNYNTSIAIDPGIPSVTVLKGFPQLEKLIMHGQCFQEMISGEMPEEQVTLSKLKMVRAHIGPYKDEQAVTFLGFLLRNSRLIVTRVFLSQRCSNIMRNKLLDLEREFPNSRLVRSFTRKWSLKWKEICEFCETRSEY